MSYNEQPNNSISYVLPDRDTTITPDYAIIAPVGTVVNIQTDAPSGSITSYRVERIEVEIRLYSHKAKQLTWIYLSCMVEDMTSDEHRITDSERIALRSAGLYSESSGESIRLFLAGYRSALKGEVSYPR